MPEHSGGGIVVWEAAALLQVAAARRRAWMHAHQQGARAACTLALHMRRERWARIRVRVQEWCVMSKARAQEACEQLKLSKTTFNKQIRALRILRWPYRKRSSLNKLADILRATLARPWAVRSPGLSLPGAARDAGLPAGLPHWPGPMSRCCSHCMPAQACPWWRGTQPAHGRRSPSSRSTSARC